MSDFFILLITLCWSHSFFRPLQPLSTPIFLCFHVIDVFILKSRSGFHIWGKTCSICLVFVSFYLVNLNLVEVTVEALTAHHWETSFSYRGILRSQWKCLGIWASMLTRHIQSLTLPIQTVPNGSILKALVSLVSSNLNSFLLHSIPRELRQSPRSPSPVLFIVFLKLGSSSSK